MTKVIIYDNIETVVEVKMEKNKSREQSTRSDVVASVEGGAQGTAYYPGSACRAGRHEEIQYFQIESGRYNPSLDFLVKVAGCLGKTVEIQIMDK